MAGRRVSWPIERDFPMSYGTYRAASALLCLVLLTTAPVWAANPGQMAPAREIDQTIQSMRTAAGTDLVIEKSQVTGLVRFTSTAKSRSIMLPGADSPEGRALVFVDRYGLAFGLDNDSVVVKRVSKSDDTGIDHVRLQQVVNGVPVAGGEAIIHMRGDTMISVLARTIPDRDQVPTTPSIDATAARAAARMVLAKHLDVFDAVLTEPRLEIFNPSLLDGGSFRPSRLAWFLEASTFGRREYVWVDAVSGDPLLHFNQMPHSRDRKIHDAGSMDTLPGTLVRSEGEGATGDTDTDNAYDFSGDTYDYYWTAHGRDSYDDAGATLLSTVHFCPENETTPGTYDCPFQNAFWNGSQMVYGEGFASADDVVGHELTHAVTERTAGLFYYYQSGALNESFSDVFGETVDLGNGAGSDTPADSWLMGEDLSIGAIRDMWNPNTYSQPGKMSDPLFWCSPNDSGGVHFNSGLPNLAFALMVDGGSFNGFTITSIGLVKAGLIHYRVLTQYLVSGSDFRDHYDAMNQACTDLVGTNGITNANCTEVDEALQAVEINSPWVCLPAQSAEPDLCGAGETAVDLFFDDFETDPSPRWTTTTTDLSYLWGWINGFATSGDLSMYGIDAPATVTFDLRLSSDVAIPAAGAKLRFNHAFGFENSGGFFYDGGFIIASTDAGANWNTVDCAAGCEGLKYGGTLATGGGNAHEGESAFVADSFGFAKTQLDLSPFAGQNLRLGFRVSTDSSVGALGWVPDDVRIFECVVTGTSEIFTDGFESGDTSAWSNTVGGP